MTGTGNVRSATKPANRSIDLLAAAVEVLKVSRPSRCVLPP